MAQRPLVINWVLTRTASACAATLSQQPMSGVILVIRWWTTSHTHTHTHSFIVRSLGDKGLLQRPVIWVECVTQCRLQQAITLTRETLTMTATIRLTAGVSGRGRKLVCKSPFVYMCVCTPQHLCRIITILMSLLVHKKQSVWLCMWEIWLNLSLGADRFLYCKSAQS